jgi:hypothetical protein
MCIFCLQLIEGRRQEQIDVTTTELADTDEKNAQAKLMINARPGQCVHPSWRTTGGELLRAPPGRCSDPSGSVHFGALRGSIRGQMFHNETLAADAWHEMPGTRCPARVAWHEMPGSIPGTRCLAADEMPGTRCLARDAWQQVPGTRCLAR